MDEVPARLPPEADLDAAWPLGAVDPDQFRAIADPRRRRLLEAMVGGPATLTELSRRLGASRQMTAYHAGVLVAAGLAEMRGHWAAARPAALRGLSAYFDRALVGSARAQAQIVARKSGLGATEFSK
jgi:hypothetical protein